MKYYLTTNSSNNINENSANYNQQKDIGEEVANADYYNDWKDRLVGHQNRYPDKDIIEKIRKLKRSDIFDHKYTVIDLFDHIYKGQLSKAKRQPNPFMIFRKVLGKVAAEKRVKIGDGTFQSKIAGFIWRGASSEEKKKFEDLAAEFKEYHKRMFPSYEYKPKFRPSTAGTAFETKMAEDYVLPNYDAYGIGTFQSELLAGFILGGEVKNKFESLYEYNPNHGTIFETKTAEDFLLPNYDAYGIGTFQSDLTGFIWVGASPEEKKKFEGLAAEYESGAIFETKSAEDFVAPELSNYDDNFLAKNSNKHCD